MLLYGDTIYVASAIYGLQATLISTGLGGNVAKAVTAPQGCTGFNV